MGPGYFDKSTWDKICSFINKRASIGTKVSGGSSFASSTTADVAPFKASEFNRVANQLSVTNHSKDDLIYGSYFDDLAKAANQYKFNESACDKCNAGCDVTCEQCQGCVACQKCNQSNTDACTSGMTCSSCNNCESGNSESYCCSCDTCQSDNPAPAS